jgi:protein NirF
MTHEKTTDPAVDCSARCLRRAKPAWYRRPRAGHRARQRHVSLVDTSDGKPYARIGGLGDLSHASVVYSRDGRYAYVFGRDGGLTKVDLLEARIVKRVLQSGNAIGGAISQDGRIVVAQNYTPGGIKAFDAETLELLSEVPAEYAPGSFSKVVGLADLSGNRFRLRAVRWRRDLGQRLLRSPTPADAALSGGAAALRRAGDAGWPLLPGRLFGEDGVALLDTWQPEQGTRRILGNYGRGQEKLPVFKMPHLRGWSMAQGNAYLPAIGRHEVLVVAGGSWQEVGRIPVKGQPVFVMARPDGRQVWVNYAFPDNGWVEVIDTLSGKVVKTLAPGKASCTWSSRRAASRSGFPRATTTGC